MWSQFPFGFAGVSGRNIRKTGPGSWVIHVSIPFRVCRSFRLEVIKAAFNSMVFAVSIPFRVCRSFRLQAMLSDGSLVMTRSQFPFGFAGVSGYHIMLGVFRLVCGLNSLSGLPEFPAHPTKITVTTCALWLGLNSLSGLPEFPAVA